MFWEFSSPWFELSLAIIARPSFEVDDTLDILSISQMRIEYIQRKNCGHNRVLKQVAWILQCKLHNKDLHRPFYIYLKNKLKYVFSVLLE